ncbi:hypothetical protein [Alloactinosynnema sp. L-07]|uniref:hypothetical protein n=1 Tax=Alloactinosynnema sp. L-07 TaxID=1653480 RepID=UPI00065EF04E|nr:hypothetical protein [Alloactinosynnema sp. L-07]CRK57744.1 hypothetical protein [Alloactinosynnema sp. L-07]
MSMFARIYPWLCQAMERGGMGEHRARLLDGLTGTLLEIGGGNGLVAVGMYETRTPERSS